MRWLERAAASCCCWCNCLQRDKSSGLTMPHGSRAQSASPVLIHYDLSGMPLFDDNDDTMDIVLYDTTVEYIPNKTRIRTALNTDSSIENLRRQLLDPKDQLLSMGNMELDMENEQEDGGEGRNPECSSFSYGDSPHCYEKTVDLETSSINHSVGSLDSTELTIDSSHQDSAMVSMFRALRCFEGDDLSHKGSQYLPGSLEVHRPRKQRDSPGRQHPKGYTPVPGNVTIDY